MCGDLRGSETCQASGGLGGLATVGAPGFAEAVGKRKGWKNFAGLST